MAVVALSALLGLFGSLMKPVPFVAALIPVLVAGTLAVALATGLSWLAALAAFYGSLAVAELSYVGAVSVRHRPRRHSSGRPMEMDGPHGL